MVEDKEISAHGDASSNTTSPTPPSSFKEPSLKEKEPSILAAPGEEGAALAQATSNVENYPTGAKLALTLLSVYLSVFLVALDRTIIATALPEITNKFHSFGDVGWVGPLDSL